MIGGVIDCYLGCVVVQDPVRVTECKVFKKYSKVNRKSTRKKYLCSNYLLPVFRMGNFASSNVNLCGLPFYVGQLAFIYKAHGPCDMSCTGHVIYIPVAINITGNYPIRDRLLSGPVRLPYRVGHCHAPCPVYP
jgi:hypothetical protein